MKKTIFLIMTAIFACLISHEIRMYIDPLGINLELVVKIYHFLSCL